MKKILPILILGTLLVLPLSIPLLVNAAVTIPAGVAPTVDIIPVLERIANYVFAILMIVAAIMIIVGGFYFVTAAGNDEIIKKAKTILTYAIAGIIVALLARGIVAFIRTVIV